MKTTNFRSLKAPLHSWLITLIAVCATTILLFFIGSVAKSFQYMKEKNQQSVETAAARLDDTLSTLRGYSERLTVENIQFRTLAQKNAAEAAYVTSELYLKELIVTQTPAYGVSLIYNSDTDKALFYYGTSVKNDRAILQNMNFMHYTGSLISDRKNYNFNQWFLYQEGGSNILLLINAYRSLYYCTMVDLDKYFELYPVDSYNGLGKMLVYYQETPLIAQTEDASVIDGEGALQITGCTVTAKRLSGCPVLVAIAMHNRTIVADQLPTVLLALCIVGLLLAFLRIIIRDLDQSLLFPIQEIGRQIARLSGEESVENPPIPGEYQEYEDIRVALTELIHQKNKLEAQNYASRQQKEHALLQYYQLQTRSHFLINCLKSLYSMSENSNRFQMQSMIIAFSNHLRYIFHDNLECVRLQDELQEVMDYHRIINLDSVVPLLLIQSVPQDLMSVPVPPLVIQTFLENTFKYADRSSGMLAFHIEAQKVLYHEVPYLRLHLFDNGLGYNEDVLERLNSEQADVFSDYQVGIVNLKHRMRLLYGMSCKTAFYNEENGGAHSVLYIPFPKGETAADAP